MKISDILKASTIKEIEKSIKKENELGLKYIYQVKKTGNYEVHIQKYGIRLLFAADKLENAKRYRDYLVLFIQSGGDTSKIVIPDNEYRGVRHKSKSNQKAKSNVKTKQKSKLQTKQTSRVESDHQKERPHLFYVEKQDRFEVYFNKSLTPLTTFAKSRKQEMLNFIENSNTRLKNRARLDQLKKLSKFERGEYDNIEEKLEDISRHLRLLKELHGDLKAPKNASGERYITKNDRTTSYNIWRVHIKLGNVVLVDRYYQNLTEARTGRRQMIENDVIPQVEQQLDYLLNSL